MIIKHEQAKEKGCPMYNQPCQGDKCMAWRWAYHKQMMPNNLVRMTKTDTGYCGMIPSPPIGSGR